MSLGLHRLLRPAQPQVSLLPMPVGMRESYDLPSPAPRLILRVYDITDIVHSIHNQDPGSVDVDSGDDGEAADSVMAVLLEHVPAGHDIPTPGSNAAEEALRTIVPAIDKQKISIAQAVQTLEAAAHIEIRVRLDQLQWLSDTSLNLHVRDGSSLREALQKLVEELSRDNEGPAIDFQIEGDQIVVSNELDLSLFKTTA